MDFQLMVELINFTIFQAKISRLIEKNSISFTIEYGIKYKCK